MSSYIAFDLDALNVCPQVGAACGLTPEQASHGLLQMWAYCFRRGTAVVEDVHLRGFFFGVEAGPALEAFGFLEGSQEGWRVKGAERYLRVQEGRSRGGKIAAANGNLKRGKKRPKPGGKLETSPSSSPAPLQLDSSLSPTTDDRAPTTEHLLKDPAPEKSARPPNPRHTPLVAALVEDFAAARGGAKYGFKRGADADAVSWLLTQGTDEEIRSRWRRALALPKWPGTASITGLRANWNELAAVAAPALPKPRDWRSAVADELRAEAAAQPQPQPEGAW